MVTARWYPNGLKNFLQGDVDLEAHDIRLALLANTHTFDDADEFFSDVSGDEVSGTGYTAGGELLTTKTLQLVDSSALSAWAASTAYQRGDVVRASPDNGLVFRAAVAGTSGGTQPTWITTPFRETADNTVVWVAMGSGLVVFDADNVSWDPSTITAAFGVVYRDSGTPTTSELLGFIDLEGDESSDNGAFTVQWSTLGILRSFAGAVT